MYTHLLHTGTYIRIYLDNKTQIKLFDNLSKLSDLTCIVINHIIETQYFFDRIFEVKENCLIEK